MKIYAILSGFGWDDAKAEFVAFDDAVDMDKLFGDHIKCWRNGSSLSFVGWLEKYHGAMEPPEDMFEVFEKD